MARKSTNTTLQITVTEFHIKKLGVICNQTGLTKSAIIQRFIEQYNMFEKKETGAGAPAKEDGN
jgi:hypothetical protein